MARKRAGSVPSLYDVEGGDRDAVKVRGPAGVEPKRAGPDADSSKGKRPRQGGRKVRGTDGPAVVAPATPRVARIFDFIQKLRIPSGVGQGDPFILRNWQRDYINNVFGPELPDGRRRIRRALLSVARKNGKTPLMAALILCFLVGPESIPNAEIVSAASDREQAAVIYRFCKQMIELDDDLSSMLACHDSIKRIVCYHMGSFYRSLAADARRQHGGGPVFIVYDELAQAQNRELFDVLSTSQDAQPHGLFMVISTQSSDPASIMSELVDDSLAIENGMLDDPYFYGKVYAVPEDADPWLEENWMLANPALGDFKMVESMRAQALKAKRSPSAAAAFKNLHLNQRVDGTAAFVNSIDWKACEAFVPDEELEGVDAFGGLDLSGRRDLTSLGLAFPLPDGRVALRSYFWTHSEELAERAKKDGAQYLVWREQGHLTVIRGRSIEYKSVAEDIAALFKKFRIRQINFDRYRIHDLKRELEASGLPAEEYSEKENQTGKLILVKHGQGYVDMSPAVDELENVILDHTLNHGGNPALTYCMSNVRLMRDPAGNRKFDKRQENRRIDGAVAAAMAISAWKRATKVPEPEASVYERRGVLVF